jgi:hypothetical protein
LLRKAVPQYIDDIYPDLKTPPRIIVRVYTSLQNPFIDTVKGARQNRALGGFAVGFSCEDPLIEFVDMYDESMAKVKIVGMHHMHSSLRIANGV